MCEGDRAMRESAASHREGALARRDNDEGQSEGAPARRDNDEGQSEGAPARRDNDEGQSEGAPARCDNDEGQSEGGVRVLYSAFDVVPSPKGASTHIRYFARGLVEAGFRVQLITAHDEALAEHDSWEGASVWRVPRAGESNFLERATAFGRAAVAHAEQAGPGSYRIAHFRSLWCGLPLTAAKKRLGYRTLFEVNGLPSVELKYHYPKVRGSSLLDKLREQEVATLLLADHVICPSAVTAAFLGSLGVPEERITVIRNGVDLELFAPGEPSVARASTAASPEALEEPVLLYVGTLADWQGLEVAVRALPLICAVQPIRLRLVGRGRARQKRNLLKLAQRLGVADRLSIDEGVPHEQIPALMRKATIGLVPLVYNDRNVTQGCCPLKLIETMASELPIVAANLPVVRELAREGEEVLLFEPGDFSELAHRVNLLLAHPQHGRTIARAAATRARKRYGWAEAQSALVQVYRALLD